MSDINSRQIVLEYHERTKHHFHRFAPSLGYLDWETQPNPFRRFNGARRYRLAVPEDDSTPAYDHLYRAEVPTASVTTDTLSLFFYYSMSLSAWKQHGGSRWSLRVNPSSGNLHPTESYLLIHPVDGLRPLPAVYHYAPREHELECRAEFEEDSWRRLTAGLPPHSFFVGLSLIAWREAWKYGERAYRYCQHDAGHALGSLRFAAALLGWRLRLMPEVPDTLIGQLIGLDRVDAAHRGEPEWPHMLMLVDPVAGLFPPPVPESRDAAMARPSLVLPRHWHGRANRLSPDHHPWAVIDQVETACRQPADHAACRSDPSQQDVPSGVLPGSTTAFTAGKIIRQRRSALAFDGQNGISKAAFLRMMSVVLPSRAVSPWDAIPWPPRVHLALFVHRVEGINAGLYVLVRNKEQRQELQQAMNPDFEWQNTPELSYDLPLFLLAKSDLTHVASRVSCHQDIAGDGAFSLGMLACFQPMIERYGATAYRQLFWETGLIGQVLYLEAEAVGRRATGIGCFFDDPVHDLLGLKDRRFQSLYHFTVGQPIEDTRLRSWPAYGSEQCFEGT